MLNTNIKTTKNNDGSVTLSLNDNKKAEKQVFSRQYSVDHKRKPVLDLKRNHLAEFTRDVNVTLNKGIITVASC